MSTTSDKRVILALPFLVAFGLLVLVGLIFLVLLPPNVDVPEVEPRQDPQEGQGTEMALGVAEAIKDAAGIVEPPADATIDGEPVLTRNIMGALIVDAESSQKKKPEGGEARPSAQVGKSDGEPVLGGVDEPVLGGVEEPVLGGLEELRDDIESLTDESQ